MATRITALTAVLCIVIACPAFAAAAAAVEEQPLVENSRFQFAGSINANSVNVRSGPSENYYVTLKLDRGASVRVVGIRFDWLKIIPPKGSFSLISKAFVKREPGATTGIVTGDNVRIRAGSHLTDLKATVQCMLKQGAVVNILGEIDEYYQIEPPPGAYLYVHQKFVDPVKQLADQPDAQTGDDGTATAQTTPATQPVAAGDTRQPRAAASAETEFDRLEAALKACLDQPLDQQPLTELLAGYEALVKNPDLSIPMRRISEVRILGLRGKADAQQELLAYRKQQEQAAARLETLAAERRALEQKAASGITIYTAVGTLQASTLQFGPGTLYRLTDPNTGRTICYVRRSDASFNAFLEKFVGVRGEAGNDPQVSLQIVTASEIATVDPATVNKTVTAQLSPPSLINQRIEHATTDNN